MTARCRGETPARQQLSLGISDHAAGPELVPLLERLHAMSSQLALSVTIGFSREMLEAYDAGELDAVVVRQEGSRRGGEKLTEDAFGWFAAKRLGLAPRRDAAAGDAGAALRRACARHPCPRQGRHCLDRELSSAAASPPWPPPPWPALRWRRWPGGSRRRVWSISGRAEGLPRLLPSKVKAALEGQRPRQARRRCGRWRRRSGAWLARPNGPFRRRNDLFR